MNALRRLGQVGLVLLLVIFVGGGYLWVKYQRAASYAQFSSIKATTSRQLLDYFNAAPPLFCVSHSTGFNTSYDTTLYVLNGVQRVHYANPNGTEFEARVDQSGIYVWKIDSLDIAQISLDSPAQENPLTLTEYASVQCTPWWHPDPALMELPPGARIHRI